MAFGVYVHIPYCLQRCHYCDFATYEWKQIIPPEQYVELIKQEIRHRSAEISAQNLKTVYFGGGTPSLIEPELILAILGELANHGFKREPGAETTIEINPATIDENKLERYLEMGINRFSVGAQSFHERLLKLSGRKHSVEDTVLTLKLLKQKRVNYSFDLLFALPTQTLAELKSDVDRALEFDPSHLSTYCLTVPESHPMSKGRAPEDEQVEMFTYIDNRLHEAGILRYEISNYARSGRESRHNLLYWTDEEFWGIGLSAHSYSKSSRWGTRYWNPNNIQVYEHQVRRNTIGGHSLPLKDQFPAEQIEILDRHQAMTDFCHMSLRMSSGLAENAVRLKFGDQLTALILQRVQALREPGLLSRSDDRWALTDQGRLLSNKVFEALTFLERELPPD